MPYHIQEFIFEEERGRGSDQELKMSTKLIICGSKTAQNVCTWKKFDLVSSSWHKYMYNLPTPKQLKWLQWYLRWREQLRSNRCELLIFKAEQEIQKCLQIDHFRLIICFLYLNHIVQITKLIKLRAMLYRVQEFVFEEKKGEGIQTRSWKWALNWSFLAQKQLRKYAQEFDLISSL